MWCVTSEARGHIRIFFLFARYKYAPFSPEHVHVKLPRQHFRCWTRAACNCTIKSPGGQNKHIRCCHFINLDQQMQSQHTVLRPVCLDKHIWIQFEPWLNFICGDVLFYICNVLTHVWMICWGLNHVAVSLHIYMLWCPNPSKATLEELHQATI